MNIYSLRSKWKFLLLLCALAIGLCSLYYTDRLVEKLSVEERKKIELWAEATSKLVEASIDDNDTNLNFYLHVIENNTTIPVILADQELNVISYLNLDSIKAKNPQYVSRELAYMKSRRDPIVIHYTNDEKQYIYYDDSLVLYQLNYYPYIQLIAIILFVAIAYFAFRSSLKSEQNRVWVGLTKETAHQLGTPISSLLAIAEMLKTQVKDTALIDELEKDTARLLSITERFSKVGSKPATPLTGLEQTVSQGLSYIRKRSSDKVSIHFEQPKEPVLVPLSAPLFGWVIENVCKNALDAMSGKGTLSIAIENNRKYAIIDISDTGKGIPKRRFKAIFKPGYTTKSRGWGLGLSLSKRIIEEYHHGKIFVLRSDPAKGTTFRIILKKRR